MSPDDVHSTRRTVLKAVGGTAVGLTVAAGAASADHEHPDVTTDFAEPTDSTADLYGTLEDFGEGTDAADVWFQWDFANDDGFSFATDREERTSTGQFSHFVDGLDSSTEYKFRAVAEDNDDGDRGYGDTHTFTTQSDDSNLL